MVPVSDYDYPIDPEGLRYILNYLYDHFHKPLFVAENGLGSKEELTPDGNGGFTVKDQARIDFHRGHIQAMAGRLTMGSRCSDTLHGGRSIVSARHRQK